MKTLLIIAILLVSFDSNSTCSIYKYTKGHDTLYWSVGSPNTSNYPRGGGPLQNMSAGQFMSLIHSKAPELTCISPDNTLANLTTELKSLFNERLKQAVDEIEKENELLRRTFTSSLSLQLDVISAQLVSLKLQISSNGEEGEDDVALKEEISNISNTVESIKEQLSVKE